MVKIIVFTFFLLFGYFPIKAQTDVFDALLKTYVDSDGNVDYIGLRKNKSILNIYLKYLENTVPNKKWSPNKSKAFWINVYNAHTIKLIIESFPLKKITDIKRKGENAWKIPFVIVGKKKYSLDYVQHIILRKWYSDSRIHVGINAASKSGPKFVNFAFTEKNIDSKLEELMKNFINDPQKNKISFNKVEISKIFEWYKEDFSSKNSLIDYLNKYSSIKANDNAQVVYLEYNWLLNEKSNLSFNRANKPR
ncbi:MAG: DUF547 domain-containing protein [Tenacibaculum sp.]